MQYGVMQVNENAFSLARFWTFKRQLGAYILTHKLWSVCCQYMNNIAVTP